eukprot:3476820-Pyramimonas_sp.AAC.1
MFLALVAAIGLFIYSATSVTWMRYPAAREVGRQVNSGPRVVSSILLVMCFVFTSIIVLGAPFSRVGENVRKSIGKRSSRDHGEEGRARGPSETDV